MMAPRTDARPASQRRVLDLGSGRARAAPDAVTLDIVAATNPDVVHDLNVFPWPFEDASFDEIHMRDVIEHLADLVRTMEELHRISRPGARIHIHTPHFSCANSYTDPTHRHHLGMRSLDYFTDGHPWNFYTEARFRPVRRELYFHPGFLRPLVRRLANRWPDAYEHRWSWTYPAWFMAFELEAVKTQ